MNASRWDLKAVALSAAALCGAAATAPAETLYVADPAMAAIYGRQVGTGPGYPTLISGTVTLELRDLDFANEREALVIPFHGEALLVWNLERGTVDEIARPEAGERFLSLDVSADGLSVATVSVQNGVPLTASQLRHLLYARLSTAEPWTEAELVANQAPPIGFDDLPVVDLVHLGNHAAWLANTGPFHWWGELRTLALLTGEEPELFATTGIGRIARMANGDLFVLSRDRLSWEVTAQQLDGETLEPLRSVTDNALNPWVVGAGRGLDLEHQPDGHASVITHDALARFLDLFDPAAGELASVVLPFTNPDGTRRVAADLSSAQDLLRASPSRWLTGSIMLNAVHCVHAGDDTPHQHFALQRGQGKPFEDILAMATLPTGSLLVLDQALYGRRLLQVDPATGNRREVAVLTGDNALEGLREYEDFYDHLEVDPQGRAVVLLGDDVGLTNELVVAAITLNDGAVEILGRGAVPQMPPQDVDIDAEGVVRVLYPGNAHTELYEIQEGGTLTPILSHQFLPTFNFVSNISTGHRMIEGTLDVPNTVNGDAMAVTLALEGNRFELLATTGSFEIVAVLVPPSGGAPAAISVLENTPNWDLGLGLPTGGTSQRLTLRGIIPMEQLPSGKLLPGEWEVHIWGRVPGQTQLLFPFRPLVEDRVLLLAAQVQSLGQGRRLATDEGNAPYVLGGYPPRLMTLDLTGNDVGETLLFNTTAEPDPNALNHLSDMVAYGPAESPRFFLSEWDNPVVRDLNPATGRAQPFILGRPEAVERLAEGASPITQQSLALGPTVAQRVFGDVNGDGQVTPGDAQAAFACFLAGGTGCPTFDVCADGAVTPGDAQTIFRTALGFVADCGCE